MKVNINRKENKFTKERKNQQKERLKRKDTAVWITLFVIAAVLSLAYMIAQLRFPSVVTGIGIAIKLVFTLGFIYFAFWGEPKPPVTGAILACLFSLFPFLSLVFSKKTILLFLLIIFTVTAIYYSLLYKKQEKDITALSGIVMTSGILLLSDVLGYTYIGDDGKFYIIAAVIAFVFLIVATIFLVKHKVPSKLADEMLEKICFVIAFTAIGFVFSLCVMCHSNYILDASQPQKKEITITSQNVESGFRRTTRYLFYTEIDGEEIEIEVDSLDYNKYNTGDKYNIYLHKGAFNAPFYMAEK